MPTSQGSGPQGSQPARSSALKRYGPLVAVVGVIAVIAVVVTLAGRKDATNSATGTGSGANGDGTRSAGGAVPLIYDEAKQQGKASTITWVDNCDPATGRIKFPSVYAPPCVPKFTGNNGSNNGGDNGGATANGVTADKVTVVYYVPSQNADVQALLSGNTDPIPQSKETVGKYVDMLNDVFEQYGRKVEVVAFEAQAPQNDAIAARADALTVLERYKPFASISGPALTGAYAEELARHGVLCLSCSTASPDSFYQENAPYVWGVQPDAEQYLVNISDYLVNRLNGRKAVNAGDELKNQTRSFGVVQFDQDLPVYGPIVEQADACLAQRGLMTAARETYVLDPSRLNERAATIIAKMKSAGVTTIVFFGDPLMPIFLTKQATAQNYFPEWIVTGTVLTDLTLFGRKYDAPQWKHAFGLSNSPARLPREQTEAQRVHNWYFGAPPAAINTAAILYIPIQQLFLGIHLAGPNLNAETFRAGLFHYPKSGGGPTTPQVSYGDQGYFKINAPGSCQGGTPRLDYIASDDVTEIWWDGTATGPDEQGKTDAPGMWRYANNGKRYVPGQLPKTDVDAFRLEGSVTGFDRATKDETPPDYPSPAKK